MAWLFGDSFDFYNTTADTTAGGGQWTTALPNLSATTRFGTGLSVQNPTNVTVNYLSTSFAASSAIIINVAMSLGATGWSPGNLTQAFGFAVFDGTAATQCGIYLSFGGRVSVSSGGVNAPILAQSSISAQTAASQWVHYQFKVILSSASGSLDVRVMGNSTSFYTVTGLNTRNSSLGTATCDHIGISYISGGDVAGRFIDDLYLNSLTGAVPNDFQGDVRAIQQMPASNSSQISWTSTTGGSTNWAQVDEFREDGDTSYVTTTSSGNFDFYNITSGTSVSLANAIVAVQTRMFSRMDDVGPHQIASQLRSGPTGATQTSSSQSMLASYQWMLQTYTTDPATSTAWTQSGVNAIQLGPIDIQ